MSESIGGAATRTRDRSAGDGGTIDTVKEEGKAVADTAAVGAGRVVDTAKAEAGSVASEVKSQAKVLYAQTQQELRQQAEERQQRVAAGLSSAGDELRAMASSGENPGLAADLVREASVRITSAGSWLAQRDPAALLSEVKSFARRKPGVFIGLALVAGIVAGRLTRALAESAAEQKEADAPGPTYVGGMPALSGTTAPPAPSTGADGMRGAPATGSTGAGGAAVGGTVAGTSVTGASPADDSIPPAPDGIPGAGAGMEDAYDDSAARAAGAYDVEARREDAGDERRDSF